jgi:hypothetical protein
MHRFFFLSSTSDVVSSLVVLFPCFRVSLFIPLTDLFTIFLFGLSSFDTHLSLHSSREECSSLTLECHVILNAVTFVCKDKTRKSSVTDYDIETPGVKDISVFEFSHLLWFGFRWCYHKPSFSLQLPFVVTWPWVK